jgi:hypothetical protein
MIAGSDGGIAISYDGGRTSDHYANIPVGEIYSIGVDMEDPYNLYAGLQDHEHWKGPSQRPAQPRDGVGLARRRRQRRHLHAGRSHDSRWLYTTRQYGGHTRVDQLQGYETNIWPRRAEGDPYRFQWITPLPDFSHDSKVIYAGAQFLLRSPDRGDHWTEISPDSQHEHKSRILCRIRRRRAWRIPWFAITSIAESP